MSAEYPTRFLVAEIRVDVEREYTRLRDKMRLLDKATDKEALRRALDQIAYDARQANKLYLLARERWELFKAIEHPKRVAGLRKAALQHLEQLREEGKLKKAPTEKMIEDHMIYNLDEYAEIEQERIELEMIMNDLKCFAEMWDGRRADVRRLAEMEMPRTTNTYPNDREAP